jgi:hypothetical protein
MTSFDSNFVHTVYFWLKNPNSETDCSQFETALKKFMQDSEYAKTNFIGKPAKSSRDVVDDSFTYSLVVSFESIEAEQLYQDEKAHELFIEQASELWNRVVVYNSVEID